MNQQFIEYIPHQLSRPKDGLPWITQEIKKKLIRKNDGDIKAKYKNTSYTEAPVTIHIGNTSGALSLLKTLITPDQT